MTALVPYNRGGFAAQGHFGSHKQRKHHYYDPRFMQQSSFIPRPIPIQPHVYRTGAYPMTGHHSYGRPNMTADVVPFNRVNEQYRYAQYIHQMDDLQKRYWKREASTMPLPMYTEPYPRYSGNGTIYEYEHETRFVPFPVFLGPGAAGFGGGRNLGYSGGLTTALALGGGPMNLPPKIRVIFIPTGLPSFQQPCTGALVRTSTIKH